MRLLHSTLLTLAFACVITASIHAQGTQSLQIPGGWGQDQARDRARPGRSSADKSSPVPGHPSAAISRQPPSTPFPGTGGEQGIIKLDVVVTDKAGNPISGLQQSDFTILDNDQPNPISAFHAFNGSTSRANAPVEVILFLDSLGVSGDRPAFEREEVERFLRQHNGHLSQPVSVYGISSKSGLWHLKDPSADGNVLAGELAQDKVIRWVGNNEVPQRNGFRPTQVTPGELYGDLSESLTSTAFLKTNPVNATLQAVSAIAAEARRRPGRKLFLWIGPGCCQGSGGYLNGPDKDADKARVYDLAYWASTLFREAHLTLYVFSEGEFHAKAANGDASGNLGSPDAQRMIVKNEAPASPSNATWMSLQKKSLAFQSGGRILYPDSNDDGKPSEVVDQINNVLREVGIFYMLSVDASHADTLDEFHDLKVQLNRPELVVYAKTGYYDQPYFIDGPNPALQRMTVAQVEVILKADRADHDAELAKRLSSIELTERMSSPRLRNWYMLFRGKKTRAALTGLADASAFLDPPADEILKAPEPDQAQQDTMLAKVRTYLSDTVPHLPNFFADRATVAYEDKPELLGHGIRSDFLPLHVADSAKATVLYHNGNEVVEAAKKGATPETRDLITYGTFGALLDYVSKALETPDTLTWSRWEPSPANGPENRRAVFRWNVPTTESVYGWGSCCLPDGDGTLSFSKTVGYFGEIAVDPDTGAILRLELKSDSLASTPPITTTMIRADIVVEYGNTIVGGTPYICPIRSVTISKIRSVVQPQEWNQSFRTWGPYQTLLNDATFDNYHRFRSDSRVLTGTDSNLEPSSEPQ